VTPTEAEATRRVDAAADLIRSAVRIGADPEYIARAVRTAVSWGAEQLAEDIADDYRKAAA
jgi:hypothetical protein